VVNGSSRARSPTPDWVARYLPFTTDAIGILVRQKPTDAPTGTQVSAALSSVGLVWSMAEYGDAGTVDMHVGRKP